MAVASLALLKRCATRLSPAERRWIAFRTMRDRFDPRTRDLANLMSEGLLAWKNCRFALQENGEARLLERLARFDPKVAIDVGANVGDWSISALACFPHAVIHAFEISGETALILKKNVKNPGGRLIINALGLADYEGDVGFFSVPESSERTSTLRDALTVGFSSEHAGTIIETSGRVTTGDAYLESHGSPRVDFLKVDVEGAEMPVFNGFARSFDRQAIDIVQFEYGTVNLMTRVLLADFYKFFEQRGFLVGKLYPEGVAFKTYDIADEDFVGPNYIACHSRRSDVIEAIRCAPLTWSTPG
jgi:FkbM family methyltransferase